MTQVDPMNRTPRLDARGFALLFVLLVLMAVAAMALTAVILSGNTRLQTAYEETEAQLEAVADAGLEQARARINGQPSLYPEEGYATLENGVTVKDAFGANIPNIKRYTYVGPTGVATGQYGVFGSVVSVAESPGGARAIRRAEVFQESFAKYAYFTDVEPANIKFGSGDQIQGPVHSNDVIGIYSSRATFRGPGQVTTHEHIDGWEYGTFLEGYQEEVARIELPTTAELDKLRSYATAGGTAFTAPSGGTASEARLRIQFINIDLDGDGQANGPDEGFFRVYTSNQADWLMSLEPGLGWPSSENCGWRTTVSGRDTFMTPRAYSGNSAGKRNQVKQATSRCYLGGDEMLTGLAFKASDGKGQWVARGWALQGAPPAALTNRPDKDYLFPLSRRFNANFKGVIHVTGKVAISGTLRGRVTLAATSHIFVVDDMKYSVDPGAGTCTDILGLFSGGEVQIADNAINTPQEIESGWWANNLDDTSSEFLQAVVLTLNTFSVQDYSSGPTSGQSCEGTGRGRGCLYLAGGIIQRTRGGVGTTGGHGYLKRYSYDVCAYRQPPPYYPTTGHFGRGRYYEIDPQGFNVSEYFDRLTAG